MFQLNIFYTIDDMDFFCLLQEVLYNLLRKTFKIKIEYSHKKKFETVLFNILLVGENIILKKD